MMTSNFPATLERFRKIGIASKKIRKRLPRQQFPDLIVAAFARDIEVILASQFEIITRELSPDVLRTLRLDDERVDASPLDVFKKLRDRLAGTVKLATLTNLAERYAGATSRFQEAQIRKQAAAALGVDLFRDATIGPQITGFVRESVTLIKNLPERALVEVEQTVTRGLAAGLRPEEIAKDIEGAHLVSKNRAKLIARDQVGKLYGRVQRVRQEALGIDHFIWRTVNDNRVRAEHREYDGKRYAWESPPPDGIPGHAINCRCYAEPDFTTILGE